MRKTSRFICLFLFIVFSLNAQSEFSIVRAFQRTFARGSLATKIEVLQDSLEHKGEDMSPLYLQSLDFITRNAELLASDNLSRELTALTVRLIGLSQIEAAAQNLWGLFGVYDDIAVKKEILSTLGDIARGEAELISILNRWVDGRNNLYRAGQDVDLELLGEAITSLGKLGDETSFPVIFAAAMLDYPEPVAGKSEEALRQVKGDYRRMVNSILTSSALREKLHVINFVVDEPGIPLEDKSWIAGNALEIALNLTPRDRNEQEMVFDLEETAVSILLAYPSVESVPNLIKHFDNALLAWERELVPDSYLIQSINSLGITKTHEAAERLTLYLELLNLYTENGQPVDSGIVLAVVNSLGTLGDKVAFDYLLYVRYLNYPGDIKEAAREALDKLKRS
ncbi:MAG: hypothetical protein JEY99_08060 [Spirochaetales bacterium]|nr:hypothetical protein [Spirochaetales bacterium]